MPEDFADVNTPPDEYRVTIENSQDCWEYVVVTHGEDAALATAKEWATEDGWNGFLLGEPKVERLSS